VFPPTKHPTESSPTRLQPRLSGAIPFQQRSFVNFDQKQNTAQVVRISEVSAGKNKANKPITVQTIDLPKIRSDSPLSMRVLGKYNAIKMVDGGDENPYTESNKQTH
jgi:hypothetical protein